VLKISLSKCLLLFQNLKYMLNSITISMPTKTQKKKSVERDQARIDASHEKMRQQVDNSLVRTASDAAEVKEYVRCEDQFREAVGFEYAELCNKLREVATSTSEMVWLKQTAISMLRRCNHEKDEVACKFFRKLENAPGWRVESLIREYMQYLKYLDCMRNYGDEKMCRRHLPIREEKNRDSQSIENIKQNLQKLPVEYVVEEGEIVVKVGRGEKLPESQFKAAISELKKMGFTFDSETKLWRRRI